MDARNLNEINELTPIYKHNSTISTQENGYSFIDTGSKCEDINFPRCKIFGDKWNCGINAVQKYCPFTCTQCKAFCPCIYNETTYDNLDTAIEFLKCVQLSNMDEIFDHDSWTAFELCGQYDYLDELMGPVSDRFGAVASLDKFMDASAGRWGPGTGRDHQCYYDGDVTGYRGHVSSTASGIQCQRWDDETPHAHQEGPDPEVDICHFHNFLFKCQVYVLVFPLFFCSFILFILCYFVLLLLRCSFVHFHYFVFLFFCFVVFCSLVPLF